MKILSTEKLKSFREKVQKGYAQVRGYKIIAASLDNFQQTKCTVHSNYSVHHEWTDHGAFGAYGLEFIKML